MAKKNLLDLKNFLEKEFSGESYQYKDLEDLYVDFCIYSNINNSAEGFELFSAEVSTLLNDNQVPNLKLIGDKLFVDDTTEINKKCHISSSDPFSFEDKVAEIMAKREHYKNIPTDHQGDGGIDFIGYKRYTLGTNSIKIVYIGQVKLYQDLVQESEIRTFLGSVISARFRPEYEPILADADIVFKYFYGHSGFNANAVITAKNCNVITLTYDDLKNDF